MRISQHLSGSAALADQGSTVRLLEFCILRFGLLQDGIVRVSVSPGREEISVLGRFYSSDCIRTRGDDHGVTSLRRCLASLSMCLRLSVRSFGY